MEFSYFLAVGSEDIIIFSVLIALVLIAFFAMFFLAIRREWKGENLCPYTRKPLRYATDLSYANMEKILRFLYERDDPLNPFIDFTKAVYCRETGRIFSDGIDMFGRISVDWSFIKKRAYGNFVSWGSLTEVQRIAIKDCHNSIEQFEWLHSCSDPDPSKVTNEFVYRKPGPLYVDKDTKVLLGWQIVPDTELEVLVLQTPTKEGRFRI
jgi:hypothetical protein